MKKASECNRKEGQLTFNKVRERRNENHKCARKEKKTKMHGDQRKELRVGDKIKYKNLNI